MTERSDDESEKSRDSGAAGRFVVLGQSAIWWGYGPEDGPAAWGGLDPSFALADCGCSQSPVDVVRDQTVRAALPELDLDWGTAPLWIENDRRTVRARFEEGHRLVHGEHSYGLVEVHHHTPSEHAIDGGLAAGELHFVHRADDGALAVVGVLLTVGAETGASLEQFVRHAPAPGSPCRAVEGVTLDLRSMLPRDLCYFAYDGSLTTPPATEGVRWFLLQQPVTIEADHLERLERACGVNNRPVQPLNARWVLRAGEPKSGAGF